MEFSRADAPVSPFNPGLRLSWTPDRAGLTYAVGKPTQNLYLLEGLDTVELP
jgi:hypothetical protein